MTFGPIRPILCGVSRLTRDRQWFTVTLQYPTGCVTKLARRRTVARLAPIRMGVTPPKPPRPGIKMGETNEDQQRVRELLDEMLLERDDTDEIHRLLLQGLSPSAAKRAVEEWRREQDAAEL